MIGPQEFPVYLKLPHLGSTSEKFSLKIFEEVNQDFGSVRLKTVMYIDRPHNVIYKNVSPTKKKATSSINLVVTVVVTMFEKTHKSFT